MFKYLFYFFALLSLSNVSALAMDQRHPLDELGTSGQYGTANRT